MILHYYTNFRQPKQYRPNMNTVHHIHHHSRTNPITIFISLTSYLLILAPSANADNLKSPSFNIQMGTINMTGGNKSSNSYKLSDTVGQTFQGPFDSTGYKIRAGFQYTNSLTPFTFSISNLNINLGNPSSGIPNTATNTLTISNGSAFGYTVKAIEDHPLLLSGSSQTIPDTSCDVTAPCTINDATPWITSTRYGFGYNMSGQNINQADFVNSTYFRPFANAQNDNLPAIVMENAAATVSATATVNYKVNISGSQAAGTYRNIIQFIAIPAY